MIFKFLFGNKFRCILQEELKPILERMNKMNETLDDVQQKVDSAVASLSTFGSNLAAVKTEIDRIRDLVATLQTTQMPSQDTIDKLNLSADALNNKITQLGASLSDVSTEEEAIK